METDLTKKNLELTKKIQLLEVYNKNLDLYLAKHEDTIGSIPKRARIRQACINSGLSSTLHGFANIFRTDRVPIRIMWSICITISTLLCLWFIIDSIVDFNQFDVITETKIKREKELDFPAITICNRLADISSFKVS